MSYTIPQNTRNQWKKLAQTSGMPYATIVGQHIYDLQGLIKVLEEELSQAKQLASTNPSSPVSSLPVAGAGSKTAELEHKLNHAREQLAAYQLEQQHSVR